MAQRMVVTIDVDGGENLPAPGSDAHEELREALWDALDRIDVWLLDGKGAERGPYRVTVLGVGPGGRVG
jgi:hypothetical protein